MLLSLVAECEALNSGTLPVTHGEWMQAALLAALHSVDEDLAAAEHDSSNLPRGYTISPLHSASPLPVVDHRYQISPGCRVWFRITSAGGPLTDLLLFLSERRNEWRLGHIVFRVSRWCYAPSQHPWAGLIADEDFCQAAFADAQEHGRRLWLSFLTPTGFELDSRDGGPTWMHLPLPKLVFASALHRLKQLAPHLLDPFPPSRRFFEAGLALGAFELTTQTLLFERHRRSRTGFFGKAEFLFSREMDEPELLCVNLLANFVFFAGVGASTAWGMGQVKRLDSNRYQQAL